MESSTKTLPSESMSVTAKLQDVSKELLEIEKELLGAKALDASILADFRSAVNRIRTTAWGVQQYVDEKSVDGDPSSVLALLAGERIRVIYQLAALVESDLANTRIKLQKGQLLQLRTALDQLLTKVKAVTKK